MTDDARKAAALLGSLGGKAASKALGLEGRKARSSKGGKAYRASHTPEQRTEAARKAALARHANTPKTE